MTASTWLADMEILWKDLEELIHQFTPRDPRVSFGTSRDGTTKFVTFSAWKEYTEESPYDGTFYGRGNARTWGDAWAAARVNLEDNMTRGKVEGGRGSQPAEKTLPKAKLDLDIDNLDLGSLI